MSHALGASQHEVATDVISMALCLGGAGRGRCMLKNRAGAGLGGGDCVVTGPYVSPMMILTEPVSFKALVALLA